MAVSAFKISAAAIRELATKAAQDAAQTNIKSQIESDAVLMSESILQNEYFDLNQEPINDASIQMFVEGGPPQILGVDFELISSGIRTNRISWKGISNLSDQLSPGDVVTVYYNIFESLGAESEFFTLTDQDIERGQVTLQSVPVEPDTAQLFVEGGIPQIYGEDFAISGIDLVWRQIDGFTVNGLNGFLAAGDTIHVFYFTEKIAE